MITRTEFQRQEVIVSNIDQWPVCYFVMDGDPTVRDFERYLDTFNKLYQRKQSFSVITHLKRYRPSPELATRTGKWFTETQDLIERYWVSNAVWTNSPGFRFVMSTVFLIKPLPIPHKVCASSRDAIEFTRGVWRARGRELQPLKWPF